MIPPLEAPHRVTPRAALQRLLRRVRPHGRWVIASTLCTFLSAGTMATFAWLAGPAASQLFSATTSGSSQILEVTADIVGVSSPFSALATLIVVVGLLRAGAGYGRAIATATLEALVLHDVRVELHDHLMRLAPGAERIMSQGEVGTRVAHESGRLRVLLQLGVAATVQNLALATALAALAFQVDPGLATLGLIGAPFIVAATIGLGRRTKSANKAWWLAEGQLAGRATENVAMLAVLQAFSAEPAAQARFAEASEQTRDRAIEATRLGARLSPIVQLLGLGAAASVLIVATDRITDAADPAAYVQLFVALLMLYSPLRGLASSAQALWTGLGALERLDELLALPTRRHEGGALLEPMRERLELVDVAFAYDERAVLSEVNLSIEPGQAVAFVGPSGGGKTTVLRVLSGLLPPTEGRVDVDGVDLSTVDPRSGRAQFGWVPQEPLLFRDTVLANIALGDVAADRARARDAAVRAGASVWIDALDGGYDTALDEGGRNLSVGQRQRLCIARALYFDAAVLVFDEPTAALDEAAEAALGETIEALLSDRTVIFSSHRPSTIARATRVFRVDGGQVVEEAASALAL